MVRLLRTQKKKKKNERPSVENPELTKKQANKAALFFIINVLSLKPGVGQSIAAHVLPVV